ETGRLPTDDDDLVAKGLTVLDPLGPLRLHNLSLHVTALGAVLAEAYRDGRSGNMHLIQRIMDSGLINQWADMFKEVPGYHTADLMWMLEKRQHAFKLTTLGYGNERILYDLNPSLP